MMVPPPSPVPSPIPSPNPPPSTPPLAEHTAFDDAAVAAPALARASGAGTRRVAALAILTLLSIYTVRLARQFAVAQRAEVDRARLAARNGALQTETTAIETETAFANSDAYVERWAREDKRWVRPGDQPVQVVQATPGAAAAPTAAPPGLFERLWGWLRR
ncbi:MAG: septum formation initiator family protein [Ardenticatenales bacterium]